MIKKKTVMGVILALLIASGPALAEGSDRNERVRGWIAESIQWRLSFLPTVYLTADMIEPFVNFPLGANTGAATMTRSKNGITHRVAEFRAVQSCSV